MSFLGIDDQTKPRAVDATAVANAEPSAARWDVLKIYLVGVGVVVLATASRWELHRYLGLHLPYITYFPAVVVAAWYGGLRGGLVATFLSFLGAWYWFVPPAGFGITAVSDFLGLILFLVTSAAVSGFSGAMYSAQRTARKEAAACQETAEFLHVTLSSMGDAMLATDMQGRVTEINPVALSLMKAERAEVLGRPLREVFPIVNESTRAPVENPIEKVLAEGRVVGLANHTILIARDGSECPIDDSAAPIRDRQGNMLGVVMVFRDIRERREAERRLVESQKRIRRMLAFNQAVINNMSDGLCLLDRQGQVTHANPRAEQLLGWSSGDLVGRDLRERVRCPGALGEPIRREEWPANRVLETGQAEPDFDDLFMRRDGSMLPVACSASPLWVDEQVDGLVFAFRDATERQRAVDAVRENERMLADFFENASFGFHWVGPDGIIQRANRADYELLGYTAEEYLGRPIADFHVSRATVDDIFARLRAGETLRDYPAQLRCKNGDIKDVLIDKSALFQDGQLIHTRCVSCDVTQQKRAEEELRQSEEQFRTLGETVPDFLYMFDARLRPLYLNPTWHRYFGVPQFPSTRLDLAEYFHPEDLAVLRPLWRQARQRRELFVGELRARRRDGQYRWFQCRAAPLKDAAGRIERWVGTMTDVNQRKLAEEQLRDADRRKDEFLATLAHELRNPLAPLSAGVQVLKLRLHDVAENAGEAWADVGSLLDVFERQTQQMVRLIDDLVEVSRISRGKIELQKERVDLRTIVEAAVEMVRPSLDAREQRLELALPPDAVPALVDPLRISQAVTNLLTNANKFALQGGTVRVELKAGEGQALLAVRDDGIGIPPEMLTRVFDMFEQGDRSTLRAQNGLGIGLTLVKSFVELHGGEVEAYSDGEGQGARFEIRLPLAMDSCGVSGARSAAAAPRAFRSRRILVVDDTRASSFMLGKLLEALGQQVETCTDAVSALEAARRHQPEIIFSDIAMPRVDGYEFARQLRHDHRLKNVMLIALTGFGQEQDRLASSDAGFDWHLVKPIRLVDLHEILSAQS